MGGEGAGGCGCGCGSGGGGGGGGGGGSGCGFGGDGTGAGPLRSGSSGATAFFGAGVGRSLPPRAVAGGVEVCGGRVRAIGVGDVGPVGARLGTRCGGAAIFPPRSGGTGNGVAWTTVRTGSRFRPSETGSASPSRTISTIGRAVATPAVASTRATSATFRSFGIMLAPRHAEKEGDKVFESTLEGGRQIR
jgi:hypothetical protein